MGTLEDSRIEIIFCIFLRFSFIVWLCVVVSRCVRSFFVSSFCRVIKYSIGSSKTCCKTIRWVVRPRESCYKLGVQTKWHWNKQTCFFDFLCLMSSNYLHFCRLIAWMFRLCCHISPSGFKCYLSSRKLVWFRLLWPKEVSVWVICSAAATFTLAERVSVRVLCASQLYQRFLEGGVCVSDL